MKIIFLSFSLLLLAIIFLGCQAGNFQVEEKPEDKIVELESRSEAPSSRAPAFQVNDNVAIIRSNGEFSTEGEIIDICDKLVWVNTYSHGSPDAPGWLPAKDATQLRGDEKSFPKGYHVRIGQYKNSSFEWLPPTQVFPVPWSNWKNLKVGDTVFEKPFGDFSIKKGVITELPIGTGNRFEVKFDPSDRDEPVEASKIFSSIEPAAIDKLSPGDIVFYNQSNWAMVLAKEDTNHVLIREDWFAAKDKIVDISKLKILR